MMAHAAQPTLQQKAQHLIARLREHQLRSANAGRVIESKKYAVRADRVREVARDTKAA